MPHVCGCHELQTSTCFVRWLMAPVLIIAKAPWLPQQMDDVVQSLLS